MTSLARDEESHGCWRKLKAKFFGPGRQRSDSSLLISVFVGLGTLVDVRLPPPKKAVNQSGQFPGSGKYRYISFGSARNIAVVGPNAVSLWRRDKAAIRSAAATRVLALFRFFFFTGLPPLVGLCGASVTCDTNCFSVGKRLKSGPYSVSTTSTVATPIASIPVRSTPLIRYKAWRIGSSPRLRIARAFCRFFTFGASCPRHSSRSRAANFSKTSLS